jgi:general secretion pathway protein E
MVNGECSNISTGWSARMRKTIDRGTLLSCLMEAGLLSKAQARDYEIKGEIQKAKLIKQRETGRRSLKAPGPKVEIGPVEMLASFHFEIPGTPAEILTEDRIVSALAEKCGLPYHKIDPLGLDASVVTLIPRPFSIKHGVVPIALADGTLTIATGNPFDREIMDQLSRSTRYRIRTVASTPADILKVITEFHGFRSSVNAAEKELGTPIDLGNLEQYVKLRSAVELEATDKHVINAVEYMLQYAYDQRASDIHIEPRREFSQARFRIDGILHDVHRIPKVVHAAVIARIKTLARMDIAEKRRPQDGRIKTHHKDSEIELRVSTLPVAFGEKAVIRIFDPDVLMQPLESLGFYPREHELFEGFLNQPHGLILVTGPTGSGKTTTLYSALRKLATSEVNVTTIEDPIEMICEGFNQVGVQPQAGITFASSLRTILRQDPDVIMVGEIRDLETAENVIQSALTGHLVLSTLHTNDASTAVTRLVDLGVPPFLIAATLTGIVAQRLVRRICSGCEEETELSFHQAQALGLSWDGRNPLTARYGRGCVQCRGTGYRGRTAIHEVLNIDERMRALISSKADIETVRSVARQEGMLSLREAAIKKMLQGLTSYEEVLWVTSGN